MVNWEMKALSRELIDAMLHTIIAHNIIPRKPQGPSQSPRDAHAQHPRIYDCVGCRTDLLSSRTRTQIDAANAYTRRELRPNKPRSWHRNELVLRVKEIPGCEAKADGIYTTCIVQVSLGCETRPSTAIVKRSSLIGGIA